MFSMILLLSALIFSQINATQSIQSILAPAIMISSCGLILLGLNNKYSSVISRIRLLNNERRKLISVLTSEIHLEYQENIRLRSLQVQLNQLLKRCELVRNAVSFVAGAIGSFVLTSILLAISYFTNLGLFELLAIIVFLFGMMGVFISVVLIVIEVRIAFKITILDVKAEE